MKLIKEKTIRGAIDEFGSTEITVKMEYSKKEDIYYVSVVNSLVSSEPDVTECFDENEANDIFDTRVEDVEGYFEESDTIDDEEETEEEIKDRERETWLFQR